MNKRGSALEVSLIVSIVIVGLAITGILLVFVLNTETPSPVEAVEEFEEFDDEGDEITDRSFDFDSDGIDDDEDNCPFDFNPTQGDGNGNGVGDACDVADMQQRQQGGTGQGSGGGSGGGSGSSGGSGSDGGGDDGGGDDNPLPSECRVVDFNDDGVVNGTDQNILTDNWGDCPEPPAECPWDLSGDGFVDFDDVLRFTPWVFYCGDEDSDKVVNGVDNCPLVANTDQADNDDDGFGNVCDNCPNDHNPGQEDVDSDGSGDICDLDDDNDGVMDADDNCQYVPNGNVQGSCVLGSEWGDLCLTDSECAGVDAFCSIAQENLDGDGEGDACDLNTCGNGICDEDENEVSCSVDCAFDRAPRCSDGKDNDHDGFSDWGFSDEGDEYCASAFHDSEFDRDFEHIECTFENGCVMEWDRFPTFSLHDRFTVVFEGVLLDNWTARDWYDYEDGLKLLDHGFSHVAPNLLNESNNALLPPEQRVGGWYQVAALGRRNYQPWTYDHSPWDNDLEETGDGLIDGADPACLSPQHNSEFHNYTQCSDGIDNDRDGRTDARRIPGGDSTDPDCEDIFDNTEYPDVPACSDGIDNDGDGIVDYDILFGDPGCNTPEDNDENDLNNNACGDGLDNDGDGAIDFPRDFGCRSIESDDEARDVAQCQDGLDNEGYFIRHWNQTLATRADISPDTQGGAVPNWTVLQVDIEKFAKDDEAILLVRESPRTPEPYRSMNDADFIDAYKRDIGWLYTHAMTYPRRFGFGGQLGLWNDAPIMSLVSGSIGSRSWDEWTTNFSAINYLYKNFSNPDDDWLDEWGPLFEAYQYAGPTGYYSSSSYTYPETYEDNNETGVNETEQWRTAGRYLAYELFQTDIHQNITGKPVWIFQWPLRRDVSETPDELKAVNAHMMHASAIFPYFSHRGFQGTWIWDWQGYDQRNDYDGIQDDLVKNESLWWRRLGTDHYTYGLYRLSQYNHYFDDGYTAYHPVNPRDLFVHKIPVWRGIVNSSGTGMLVAAHNSYQPLNGSYEFEIEYEGMWIDNVTVHGLNIWLGECVIAPGGGCSGDEGNLTNGGLGPARAEAPEEEIVSELVPEGPIEEGPSEFDTNAPPEEEENAGEVTNSHQFSPQSEENFIERFFSAIFNPNGNAVMVSSESGITGNVVAENSLHRTILSGILIGLLIGLVVLIALFVNVRQSRAGPGRQA